MCFSPLKQQWHYVNTLAFKGLTGLVSGKGSFLSIMFEKETFISNFTKNNQSKSMLLISDISHTVIKKSSLHLVFD